MEEECVVWCLEGGQEEGVKRARWESLEEGGEVWPQVMNEITEENNLSECTKSTAANWQADRTP